VPTHYTDVIVMNKLSIYSCTALNWVYVVVQLVEALRCEPEGCVFYSQWSHWLNSFGHNVALGSTQPLTEMSTRDVSCKLKAAGA